MLALVPWGVRGLYEAISLIRYFIASNSGVLAADLCSNSNSVIKQRIENQGSQTHDGGEVVQVFFRKQAINHIH